MVQQFTFPNTLHHKVRVVAALTGSNATELVSAMAVRLYDKYKNQGIVPFTINDMMGCNEKAPAGFGSTQLKEEIKEKLVELHTVFRIPLYCIYSIISRKIVESFEKQWLEKYGTPFNWDFEFKLEG